MSALRPAMAVPAAVARRRAQRASQQGDDVSLDSSPLRRRHTGKRLARQHQARTDSLRDAFHAAVSDPTAKTAQPPHAAAGTAAKRVPSSSLPAPESDDDESDADSSGTADSELAAATGVEPLGDQADKAAESSADDDTNDVNDAADTDTSHGGNGAPTLTKTPTAPAAVSTSSAAQLADPLVVARTALFAAAAAGGVGRAALATAVDELTDAVAAGSRPGWEGAAVRHAAGTLVTLAQGPPLRPLSAKSMVQAAMALDAIYFPAYYAQTASSGSAMGGSVVPLPPPEEFLRATLPPAAARRKTRAAFVHEATQLCAKTASAFARTWGMVLPGEPGSTPEAPPGSWRKSRTTNPLLALARLRLDEGLLLWWRSGLARKLSCDADSDSAKLGGMMDAAADLARTAAPLARGATPLATGYGAGPRAPPRAPQLLARWRDAARDWTAHLYAYAVPNERALTALVSLGPLVEMGAGTGYWAHELQQRGADVVALDLLPPAPVSGLLVASETGGNAYHGHAPTFTAVHEGRPEDLGAAEHAGRVLLLCYPPPDSNMAQQSLRHLRGDDVAYIGEWQGVTATAAFERTLVREFRLVRTLSLPCFDNQACTLSLWRRRESGSLGLLAVPPLRWLGPLARDVHTPSGEQPADHGSKTAAAPLAFRCRFCRVFVVGSADKDARVAEHAAIHAVRHIVLRDASVLERPGASDAAAAAAWVALEGAPLHLLPQAVPAGPAVAAKPDKPATKAAKAPRQKRTEAAPGPGPTPESYGLVPVGGVAQSKRRNGGGGSGSGGGASKRHKVHKKSGKGGAPA